MHVTMNIFMIIFLIPLHLTPLSIQLIYTTNNVSLFHVNICKHIALYEQAKEQNVLFIFIFLQV